MSDEGELACGNGSAGVSGETGKRNIVEAPLRELSHPLIAIVGPTASGKTDVALKVAHQLQAEIISCDSMQIYRGMDIGTGKLPEAQRNVVHYGLDLIEPGQPFSAALFQEYARPVVQTLDDSDKRCVLCGGTGFYVRAVIDDYDFPAGEQQGNKVRDTYNEKVREIGTEAVWGELDEVDHASAALIEPHDAKRVVRAFELLADGTSYAIQHEKLHVIKPYYPCIQVGLRVDPDILRARIDARVDAMMRSGLVDEVTDLLNCGLRDAITAQQAIGYKEIVAALDGRCTLDEAVTQIKYATHRYAKRQRTWFRKDKRIHWLDADSSETDRLARETIEWVARMEQRERFEGTND